MTLRSKLIWTAAAFTVVVLFAGFLALSRYLDSDAFRRRIVDGVNAAVYGSMKIEDHRLSLLSGKLSLGGVQIRTPDGALLADIQRIDVALSWFALAWRTIRIKSFDAAANLVDIRYDDMDRLQFLGPRKNAEADSAEGIGQSKWSLRFDAIRLSIERAVYQRPAKDVTMRCGPVLVDGGADLGRMKGQGRFSTGAVTLERSSGTRTLNPLAAVVTYDPSAGFTLTLDSGQSHLAAKGSVAWKGTASEMDISADLALDLSELQPWFSVESAPAGVVSSRMRIEGRLDDPAVAMQVSVAGGQWMDTAMDRLNADLRFDQRHVVIKTLDSHSAWGDLHASGSIGFAPLFSGAARRAATVAESLSYDMTIRGENLQPGRIERLSFPWSGAFGLNLRIDGHGLGNNPASAGRIVADVQASGIGLKNSPEPAAGQLSTELHWQGKVLDVVQTTAVVGSSKLEATARVDFAAGRIDTGRIRLSAPNLEDVGALLGAVRLAGSGTLQIDCDGPLVRPNARIEILGHGLAIGPWPLGRLLALGRIDGEGMVQIPRLVLENQGSLIEGEGSLALRDADGNFRSDPDLSLSLAIAQLEPADFALRWPVDSRFKGRLTLDGPLHHLNAALTLDESVLRWNDHEGLARGTARWRDGALTVDSLTLSRDDAALVLKGSVQWRDPVSRQWRQSPLIQAQLVSRDMHLGRFDSSLKGTVTAQARVDGPLEQLSGNFKVSAVDLVLGGQPLHAAAFKGRIADKTIFLDTLKVDVTADQTIAGSARVGFDRHYWLALDSSGVDLVHIPVLQRAYPVEGQLVLHAEGRGTASNPSLSADLAIRKPRLDGRPWDDFAVHLQLGDHRLDVAADLNFMLKGYTRIDSGMFELQADLDHADLSPYLALAGGSAWNGQVTGKVQAAGNWRQPQGVQGQLTIDEAALGYQDLTVLRVRDLHARMRDGTLDLPATRLELLHDGYLELSASGVADGHLRTSLNGRLPLSALAPFTDMLAESQGDLTIQAGSQGPLDGAQWQAVVTFEGVGFVMPGIDQPVHDVHGSLRFSPAAIAVDHLTGAMDSGQFSLTGQLQLDGLQPTRGRMTLEATALPLQWQETLDAVVNARLSLEAGGQGSLLSGKAVVLEGSYHKDVRLNLFSAVTQARRSGPAPVEAKVSGPLGDIRLDVGVTHRYPFLVDNNVARLEIAPDLKLTGTVARPVISGRATISEGDIIFRRKTFSVKRGVVDFVNPYKIEPRIDLSAEAQIRQWLVSLSVTGPPDALVFKLTSDPPESENDILSLILLGRTSAELNQRSGGGPTTQQMLAALVATAWGEDLKRQAGVDILEVETVAGQNTDDAGRLQVTVGKHLSRRLTVKYEVESGSEEMVQRAVSEYRFLEHFLASGFQDSQGTAGGELLFRIEF